MGRVMQIPLNFLIFPQWPHRLSGYLCNNAAECLKNEAQCIKMLPHSVTYYQRRNRMRTLKTFYIRTYGCQMNELDCEIMVGQLENRGLTRYRR